MRPETAIRNLYASSVEEYEPLRELYRELRAEGSVTMLIRRAPYNSCSGYLKYKPRGDFCAPSIGRCGFLKLWPGLNTRK